MTGFTTTTKHPHTVDLLIERLENLPVSDYHGLDSPGLTCYLNSVLQVLFMTNDFREAVRRCCSEYSMNGHLRQLFIDLERKMTTTHKITEKLGIRNIYKQRDAAECFEKILCRTSPEASKIFKGELNHKTTCNVCNKKNDSRSSFWLLPLAVVESHCETFNVGQGLKDFFKEQTVHGDNQVYCNRCDKKQNAHIKPELTQNPDVLTLLLKRFTFDYKQQCYVKVHCTADVPRTLYLEQCTYDLYAVVNHFGALSGGHYTAEIKSFENGNWYCFNDNTVKNLRRQPFKAQEESLRSHTAYLLMYRKVNKKLGKTDGKDQDAHSAHSHIESERRQDTDKEKETQLQIGGCIGGVNHVVYDHSPVNTAWGKRTNHSVEPDGLQQKKTFPLKDNEANGDGFSMQTQKLHFAKRRQNGYHHELNGWQLCTNSKEHACQLNTEGTLAVNLRMHQEKHNTQKKRPKANKAFYETQDGTGTKTGTKPDGGSARETVNPAETKCVEQKVEVELKGKNLKQRKEARVSDVSDSGVKSNSSASVPSWAGRSHSQSRLNRPTECTHSPDRRSSSLNRNKVKTRYATQTVTMQERLRKKREAKRCKVKSVRPQWR